MFPKAIATQQNLHLDTVYDRRKHWLTAGFISLAEKHRSGAPSKVSAVQKEQLRVWATQEALTARELLIKLKEEFDIVMHPSTLSAILREMKFVCKRTRHNSKKARRTEISHREDRNWEHAGSWLIEGKLTWPTVMKLDLRKCIRTAAHGRPLGECHASAA